MKAWVFYGLALITVFVRGELLMHSDFDDLLHADSMVLDEEPVIQDEQPLVQAEEPVVQSEEPLVQDETPVYNALLHSLAVQDKLDKCSTTSFATPMECQNKRCNDGGSSCLKRNKCCFVKSCNHYICVPKDNEFGHKMALTRGPP